MTGANLSINNSLTGYINDEMKEYDCASAVFFYEFTAMQIKMMHIKGVFDGMVHIHIASFTNESFHEATA